MIATAALSLALAQPSAAQFQPPRVSRTARIAGSQLLAWAAGEERAGRPANAMQAYEALKGDPSAPIRAEARFRLALMAEQGGRLTLAATLFRQILDDQPAAAAVRLRLAGVLDRMGDEAGARRALREAQAGGLPPEVARLVDRWSAALRSRKPFGGSTEWAIAPDSNINRATGSDHVGTVIGDFDLNDDARRRSGIGLAWRGQGYARLGFGKDINLLTRLSGSANLYRDADYRDVSLALSSGPELALGRDRLTIEAQAVARNYGGQPYSRSLGMGVTLLHPMGQRAQLRLTGSLARTANRRNAQQSGTEMAGSMTYERALSERMGISATLSGQRQSLRSDAYSLTGGAIDLLAYREVGATTWFVSAGAGRVRADERLALFPDKREDRSLRAGLGVTFRQLTFQGFAPLARFSIERNRSSVDIYAYQRHRFELGVTRAF